MAGQKRRKGGKGNPVGAARASATDDRMWVCRGCCCGTKTEHPGVDHRGLEKALRAGAQRVGLRYEVTGCLGPCQQGNLVVVRCAGSVRWYRRMNSADATTELLEHLEHGDALPAVFERHLMPSRDDEVPEPD